MTSQSTPSVANKEIDPTSLGPFYLSLIHEAESIGRVGRMDTLCSAVTYASDKYAEGAGKLYGLLTVTSSMAREYIASLGMIDAMKAVMTQPPWITRYGSEDDKAARKHYSNVMSYIIDLQIRGNKILGIRESLLEFSCAEHKEPNISVKNYIDRIMRYAPATKEMYIVVIILIDRLIAMNPGMVLTGRNVHRLVVTAVVVASKMFDDFFFTNKYLAVVAGVSTEELNQLELRFLTKIRFSLFVKNEIFAEYRRLFEQVVSFARSNENLTEFFDTIYSPFRAQIISKSNYRKSNNFDSTNSAKIATNGYFANNSAANSIISHSANVLMTSTSTSPALSASPHSIALTVGSSRSSVSSVSALSLYSARGSGGNSIENAHTDESENVDDEELKGGHQRIKGLKGNGLVRSNNSNTVARKCKKANTENGNEFLVNGLNGNGGNVARKSVIAENALGDVIGNNDDDDDDIDVIVEGVGDNGFCMNVPY